MVTKYSDLVTNRKVKELGNGREIGALMPFFFGHTFHPVTCRNRVNVLNPPIPSPVALQRLRALFRRPFIALLCVVREIHSRKAIHPRQFVQFAISEVGFVF
jgi:hypothetical protein